MITAPDTIITQAAVRAVADKIRNTPGPIGEFAPYALASFLEAVADQLRDTDRLDAAQRLMLNMEIVENVAGNIERRLVALSRENLDRLIAEAGR